MSERKNEILQAAIEMVADQGYASLTMRALARACGIKLGTLQFHFRTSEDMWRALVDYISKAYHRSFQSLRDRDEPPKLREIVIFVLEDQAGDALCGDRLWPQLWAMQQVEPLVSDLVEDLYAYYVEILEHALEREGSGSPHAEALALISLLEGSTIFLGSGRRWASDAMAVRTAVLELIDGRYGGKD
jgi:AcrR family transcriptional regulator